MVRTVAFFSYTRHDDRASGGRLSIIRQALEERLRSELGDRTLEVFQDIDDIRQGDEWARRLEEGLDSAAFLIPVVTPSYFASEACMMELDRFRAREAELGRVDLILPIYWVRGRSWERSPNEDDARTFVYARQHDDWRELNHRAIPRDALIDRAERMAEHIADRFDEIEAERARLAESKAEHEARAEENVPKRQRRPYRAGNTRRPRQRRARRRMREMHPDGNKASTYRRRRRNSKGHSNGIRVPSSRIGRQSG